MKATFPRLGIMQGRLGPPEGGRFQSFPREGWRSEFSAASGAGLDTIEWIYDSYGESCNPIATETGLAEMRALCEKHRVAIVSVCADYFMEHAYLRVSDDERRNVSARLYWLIERSRRLGIERIVLPFVDASSLRNDADHASLAAMLADVLPLAEHSGIELHLETDLAPLPFAQLLEAVPHPMVRVNYDSGNSASLGFAPSEEFAAYGHRLGSVHIKDRELGGSTKPLGTGGADLSAVFEGLARLGYLGDYVLQAARGESGAEVALASQNREFVAASIARFARGEVSTR